MKAKAKAVSAKNQTRKLIDVRQKIEAGIADLNAGRRHSHASIKREFGVA